MYSAGQLYVWVQALRVCVFQCMDVQLQGNGLRKRYNTN